jgi:hypothetical protein
MFVVLSLPQSAANLRYGNIRGSSYRKVGSEYRQFEVRWCPTSQSGKQTCLLSFSVAEIYVLLAHILVGDPDQYRF